MVPEKEKHPDDKTCRDCENWDGCKYLLKGCIKPEWRECDWIPSNFKQSDN